MPTKYYQNAGNGLFNLKMFYGSMPVCRPVSLAQAPPLYKFLDLPLLSTRVHPPWLQPLHPFNLTIS